jgi:hypothetical protein
MGLKPIPLSAYTTAFTPPVTGINGSLAPVANNYDTSGHFANRIRSGSASKRKRSEELDAVYDLGAPYPPVQNPEKPRVDLSVVRSLVVAARVAGNNAKKVLEEPDTDPKLKAFGSFSIALLEALEAILESGLGPLSGVPPGSPLGVRRRRRRSLHPPPGLKGLREGLEKADREYVLFGANLGQIPVANRNVLASAFTAGLKDCAASTANEQQADLAEMTRDLDDALSCVTDMEFLGAKSKKFLKEGDTRSNTFCTLPIKFKFDDRNSRINFEKTLWAHTGLWASISIPGPVRDEMKAMRAALMERYPGEIIVVRLDTATAELKAIRKFDKAESWVQCHEKFALPAGILLPGYQANKVHTLPPVISVDDAIMSCS